jgi:PAS domain S-box-containing protein
MAFKGTTKQADFSIDSHYKDLIRMMPVATYLCDTDGYIMLYNDAAAKLWGREPEIGKDLWCGSWKIFTPDGAPINLSDCPMALTLKEKQPVVGFNIIVEQPGGKRFHVRPHPHPVYDDQGVMRGAINVLVDLTDQLKSAGLELETQRLNQTLDTLKKSEERYHKMTAEVQDYAIILLSRDGIIENWNKGAERIKGYTESEIIGKSFHVFYSEEDRVRGLPDQLMRQARENGKANHEGWRIRKDGTRFWGNISITALHDAEGNVIGFSKVTRDLTKRKEHEQRVDKLLDELRQGNDQLRRNEERYHGMVAEVEDYVIILLDLDGYIQNWNKGAQKIKGYGPEEIIGKHFRIFYAERDLNAGVPQSLLSEAHRQGKATHEGWRIRKNGSKFWGSMVLTAIHNNEGAVIGYTKVTRDLTEKKLAEEALMATTIKLEQKNKELERTNEELSSFAYVSSHDLQEPLRKIQTFADRIMELEHDRLSEKGRDYFGRMQAGAMRMQKLIRDILAYSRTTTSEKTFERIDLKDILAQSKQELEVMIMEKKAVIEDNSLPVLNVIPFRSSSYSTTC